MDIFFVIFSLLLFCIMVYCMFYRYGKRKTNENFNVDYCKNSNSIDSIRSCFSEVIKGKEDYINNLENSLKQKSNNNTSEINNINKKIITINNNMEKLQKNVSKTSNLLKTKQNDILSKTNNTTQILKKAQQMKDNIDNQ